MFPRQDQRDRRPGDGEELVGGWIVLEDGEERGAIRNTATGTVKGNAAGVVNQNGDLARTGP